MLTEKYGRLPMSEYFPADVEYHPYPEYEERDAWSEVPADLRHFWIDKANPFLSYTWPALRMDKYMNAERTGNISDYLNDSWERRSALGAMVIAECVEGNGRFIDQIVNGIYAICEETSWMQPISNTKRKGLGEWLPAASDHVVDLAAGETAALLTWTLYLLRRPLAEISGRIGERIAHEVRSRVLVPYIDHDDYWWHGFQGNRVNNWNPWCNGNVLMGFLVLERDQEIREQGLRKIMRSLDVFLMTHSPDGCCDEGPMYWGRSGGSLYDCLELMYTASGGRIDLFGEPLVREIGKYAYKVHIHEQYNVDFADGDAIVRHPSDLLYAFGQRIGDEKLTKLGAALPRYFEGIICWFPLYRYVRALFQEADRLRDAGDAPYVRDAWMEAAHVMIARENEGSATGLFLAAKGGHNLESHNHNDVGSFIVYADGRPVLIDLGTEEYTTRTFSPQRFELWYLQSQFHNLPTVRGVMQQDGKAFRATDVRYRQDDGRAELSMGLAEAYPPEAGIADWRRTIRLDREAPASIEVTDEYDLSGPSAELMFNLMTVCEPQDAGQGVIALEYAPEKRLVLKFDADRLSWSGERIELADRRLRGNWGGHVYRLVLTAKSPENKGNISLSIVRTQD